MRIQTQVAVCKGQIWQNTHNGTVLIVRGIDSDRVFMADRNDRQLIQEWDLKTMIAQDGIVFAGLE